MLCSHVGDIIFNIEDYSGHQYIGGVAGYCTSKIQNCEHLSDLLESNTYKGYYSPNEMYIGGVSGKQTNTVSFCRAIIKSMSVNLQNKSTFYMSDIAYNASCVNCYSSISTIKGSSKESGSKIVLSTGGTACYRNSDAAIDVTEIVGNVSDAYSSDQMQTQAFLEELNMYSILEMDGPVWTQDKNGGYPYIAELDPKVEQDPKVCDINVTNFPDAAFRNYLLSQDYGKDGILTVFEQQSVTNILANYLSISSLKGIEYFTALEDLTCYTNNLTELDLSHNTQLTAIRLGKNHLTSLDLSNNTALRLVNVFCNNIRGKQMDDLINSLPTNTTGEKHRFLVYDTSDEAEQNICTSSQVDAAKAKGWTVECYNGEEWKDYKGSDDEQPVLKGDVNGDNEVNGTDLVAMTNMILGKTTKNAAADLNGDGEVNGTDYVALVNIVLGKK